MKKIIGILLTILALTFTSNIQTNAQTFQNGDMVLNAGLGFGYAWGFVGGVSSWPALNVSIEKGFREIDNLGILSLGGTLGFQHASVADLKWNDFMIGARSALHLDMINVDKLDVYGGLSLGLRFYSTPSWTYDAYFNSVYTNKTYVGPFLGLFAGARYYLADNIAVFSELGYDVAWFKLGASFKF